MKTYTVQDWQNDRDFKASVGQKVERRKSIGTCSVVCHLFTATATPSK